jgi:hypothetical protein
MAMSNEALLEAAAAAPGVTVVEISHPNIVRALSGAFDLGSPIASG